MKKRLLQVLLSLLFLGSSGLSSVSAQTIRMASYNIRYDNPGDSGNLWKDRSPYLVALVRYHDFDLFGTQEGLEHQLQLMQDSLRDYDRFGAGRDDGRQAGEHSAIFYKRSVFELLRSGNFWLSATPDTPSMGWDAKCCKRICSWVELRHRKSGKRFFCFNAHFDHEGVVAREESSKLILQRIRSIAGDAAVIFCGDLNGSRSSGWYQTVIRSGWLRDSYSDVQFPYANNTSFNGWGRALKGNEVIDHIFVNNAFRAVQWGILTDTYFGKFPSDHFPVLALLQFR
ncbi:endonuclease/exonuclease/phosphatase family protein [Flavihumibacter petaseus]|uniref:Endonuclease/exonuclease/phosphatase domain-containing protein n=1 Tax=Flavihumibacter petaseus NBRC 106054 TaxID=1220578 RepID=A0A0E9N512_9BACT|nr:endonuclease/exonuclease/phosphatase family protein [Flavihumibacter petaseus]GAO44878.1 hypothetical protein FPE01S_04_01210 [Flavihumibacter petaseus NBRC 106054]